VLAAYFRMICFHFAIMLPYLFFSRLHRNGRRYATWGHAVKTNLSPVTNLASENYACKLR
jgi:hypothetical protein